MRRIALAILVAGTALWAAPRAHAGEPGAVEVSLASIDKLRKAGDVEGAARRAEALVASHPDALTAHVTYQDLEIALGQEKAVLDIYRKRARDADDDPDAHYLLARLLRGRAAETEYRAALKLAPDHFWALCGLGQECTEMGKLSHAQTPLVRAAEIDPRSAVPPNLLGRLAEADGRPIDAEKHYRDAVALDESLVIARVNLAVLLTGTRRVDEAKIELARARELAPKDTMPLLALGMAHMAAGQPEEAAKAYEEALRIDARSVDSLNLLANAYFNLEQLPLAEKALERAREIDPDRAETHVNLALLHLLRAENERAEFEASTALKLDPESAEATYMIGLAWERAGKTKKAESQYRKAAKLAPTNPVYPRAMAQMYESMGKWREAIRSYKEVVDLTDGAVCALFDLGLAYAGAGKARQAADCLERVVEVDPNHVDGWFNLGVLFHVDLREKEQAARCYREYLDRGGTDTRVRDWLASLTK